MTVRDRRDQEEPSIEVRPAVRTFPITSSRTIEAVFFNNSSRPSRPIPEGRNGCPPPGCGYEDAACEHRYDHHRPRKPVGTPRPHVVLTRSGPIRRRPIQARPDAARSGLRTRHTAGRRSGCSPSKKDTGTGPISAAFATRSGSATYTGALSLAPLHPATLIPKRRGHDELRAIDEDD